MIHTLKLSLVKMLSSVYVVCLTHGLARVTVARQWHFGRVAASIGPLGLPITAPLVWWRYHHHSSFVKYSPNPPNTSPCGPARCVAPYLPFTKTRVYIDLQSTSVHGDSDVSPLLATQ